MPQHRKLGTLRGRKEGIMVTSLACGRWPLRSQCALVQSFVFHAKFHGWSER
jgi:hypothetical protein